VFQSCLDQASNPALLEDMKVEPNFRGKHAMLMVHVWIVHRRLLQVESGAAGKKMQEALFDRCWEHSTKAIRNLEVSELTVNKHLKELQKVSFGAMVSYDGGLATGDNDEFAGALYRNLYAMDEAVPESSVYSMAKYVRKELAHIDTLPLGEVMEQGRLSWTSRYYVHDLVDVDSRAQTVIRGGAAAEGAAEGAAPERAPGAEAGAEGATLASVEDAEASADEWREALDERGRVYYWNVRTRASSWEEPASISKLKTLKQS
jgi:cytochrome b pre-mRNA-processing protein 3